MNQPCELNENYARHLLSRLCILQPNMGMRTSKLDCALQLISNHSSITQSAQCVVPFASGSDFLHVRFITKGSYSGSHHICEDRVRPSLSFRGREVLTLQCDLSKQIPLAKTNRADFVLSMHGVCFLPKQVILMDPGLALDLNTNYSQE